MHALGCLRFLATILVSTAVILSTTTSPASVEDEAVKSRFPRPAALEPNIEFWKQIYAEYGVRDFVLHDRENLGITYDVVRIHGAANEIRAAAAAKPEIQRLRDKYAGILESLAQGVSTEELGPDGARVAEAWGCPCPPERLRRAAANIRVQQGLRERVQEGTQRARRLLPGILPILRQHNVPEELAALPMVESSFDPRAKSKAGAVGLWQFIRSTGKRYLTIRGRRDDRRDPVRATKAAARLLKDNYEALGSWPLAITAYNHGQEGMLAARTAVGSSAIEEIIERYSGPRFGFASRNFYAEFLAALEVIQPFLPGHARPVGAKTLQRSGQKGPLPETRSPVPSPVEGPFPAIPSPAPRETPDAPPTWETTLAPVQPPASSPPLNAEPRPEPSEPATDSTLAPTAPQEPLAAEQGAERRDADRSEVGIP